MHSLSRRELFLRAALVAGSGCICSMLPAAEPRSNCCSTPELEPDSYVLSDGWLRIDLRKARSLESPGSAAYVLHGADGGRVLLVRSAGSTYQALSGLCTHARQVLSYVSKRRLLMCNGFNHSLFRLDGTVYKGPAESRLTVYPVRARRGFLEVDLMRAV